MQLTKFLCVSGQSHWDLTGNIWKFSCQHFFKHSGTFFKFKYKKTFAKNMYHAYQG